MHDLEPALRTRFAQLSEPELAPAPDLLRTVRRRHARRRATGPAAGAVLVLAGAAVAVPALAQRGGGRPGDQIRVEPVAASAPPSAPVTGQTVTVADLVFDVPAGLELFDRRSYPYPGPVRAGHQELAQSVVYLGAGTARISRRLSVEVADGRWAPDRWADRPAAGPTAAVEDLLIAGHRARYFSMLSPFSPFSPVPGAPQPTVPHETLVVQVSADRTVTVAGDGIGRAALVQVATSAFAAG